MLRSKTHFEQVPLETVRKIIEEQRQRETSVGEGTREETLEGGFAGVEEPSWANITMFLTGSDRNDS